jgi:uncharacterized protein YrrD
MRGENIMDISLKAVVQCKDGPGGHATTVVFNPVSNVVTHIVVLGRGLLPTEYLVPVTEITAGTHDRINLNCTRDELSHHKPFKREVFVVLDAEDDTPAPQAFDLGLEHATMWPFAFAEGEPWGMVAIEEQVPLDELGIHRGAHVEALDGRVGSVDGFLVNPENECITHLVLREGHLWGQRDVTIPMSEVTRIAEDVVYLRLNKKQLQELPAISVTRRWR